MSVFEMIERSNQKTASTYKRSSDGERSHVISKAAKVLQENSWTNEFPKLVKLMESDNTMDKYRGATTILCMNNINQFLKSRQKPTLLTEATVTSSLGAVPGKTPQIIDVVGIFFPNMTIHLFSDMQVMEKSTGQVFIIKPTFTDTAAGITAGNEMFLNPTDGTYASAWVSPIAATVDPNDDKVFTATLPASGFVPGSVTLMLNNEVVAKAVPERPALLVGETVTAAVSGTTLTATFDAAPSGAVSVTYQKDYENDASSIREVEVKFGNIDVEAKPHPLKAKFSMESALTAEAHLGEDVNELVNEEAASLIRNERDIEGVLKVSSVATTDALFNFDATMTGVYYPKKSKYGEISLKLEAMSNHIRSVNKRGGMSYILCGTNAVQLMQNIPGFVASNESVAPIGPYLAGTIKDGTVPVICVPYDGTVGTTVLNANTYIVGFRGYRMGDAALIVADWVPLLYTQLWESPDLVNQRGFLSLYDTVMNRSSYIMKGTVSNFGA